MAAMVYIIGMDEIHPLYKLSIPARYDWHGKFIWKIYFDETKFDDNLNGASDSGRMNLVRLFWMEQAKVMEQLSCVIT